MWYAIYSWTAQDGWRLRNAFEDENPDLARSMAIMEDGGDTRRVALIEGDTRDAAESYPRFGGKWRRLLP